MGITKQNDRKDDEYLYPHNEAERNSTRHTSTPYPFTPTVLKCHKEASGTKLHLLRIQSSVDMTNFQMLFTSGNQKTGYSGPRELKKYSWNGDSGRLEGVSLARELGRKRAHQMPLSSCFTAERVARLNLDPLIFRFRAN
jgi:hypothetical protein